jgi:hypothetical protein
MQEDTRPQVLANTRILISNFPGRNLPTLMANFTKVTPGSDQVPLQDMRPVWTSRPSSMLFSDRTRGAGLDQVLRELLAGGAYFTGQVSAEVHIFPKLEAA